MADAWRPDRTLEERYGRALESMVPGTVQGRVAQAQPVRQRRLLDTRPYDPDIEEVAGGGDTLFWQDEFILDGGGAQVCDLTWRPNTNSEHVYWHPSSGAAVYLSGAGWSRFKKRLTVADLGGLFRSGDKITVEYAYNELIQEVEGDVILPYPEIGAAWGMGGPYTRTSDPQAPGETNGTVLAGGSTTYLMDFNGGTWLDVDGYIGPSGVFANRIVGHTEPILDKYPTLPSDWNDANVWSCWAWFDADPGVNLYTVLAGDGRSCSTDRSKTIQCALGELVFVTDGPATLRNAYVGYEATAYANVPSNRDGYGQRFTIRDCYVWLIRNSSIGYTP